MTSGSDHFFCPHRSWALKFSPLVLSLMHRGGKYPALKILLSTKTKFYSRPSIIKILNVLIGIKRSLDFKHTKISRDYIWWNWRSWASMPVVYMSNEKKTYYLVPAVNKPKQLSPLYLINRERKERNIIVDLFFLPFCWQQKSLEVVVSYLGNSLNLHWNICNICFIYF